VSSPTRRAFLKTIGQAGLFCAAPGIARAAATPNDDTVQISILHTTDLHGHILPTSDYAGNADLGGFARCVTQIRRWRRQNRNSILIDVGDVYQGTDVGLRTNGALIIDLFNHLKYDAWIVGNHEFDWGVETFGFEIETEGSGYERRIAAVRLADDGTLERDKRYLIAFNTFDSRSAGHRFMRLRALLETAPTRCTFHPVQTRDAVIDYFRRHQVVHKIAAQNTAAAAAAQI
jgi:hypothetical protein